MGRTQIFEAGESPFVDPVDVYPAEVLPLIPPAELAGTRVRMHHPGSPELPQLFEVEVDAGLELASHAHDSAEIIVVVEGALRVGKRMLGVGSSILVEGDTLYSVTAGPDGARFLNFRGAADYTYLDRAGYMQRRAARGTTDEP